MNILLSSNSAVALYDLAYKSAIKSSMALDKSSKAPPVLALISANVKITFPQLDPNFKSFHYFYSGLLCDLADMDIPTARHNAKTKIILFILSIH